jgi:hypothetical protein
MSVIGLVRVLLIIAFGVVIFALRRFMTRP